MLLLGGDDFKTFDRFRLLRLVPRGVQPSSWTGVAFGGDDFKTMVEPTILPTSAFIKPHPRLFKMFCPLSTSRFFQPQSYTVVTFRLRRLLVVQTGVAFVGGDFKTIIEATILPGMDSPLRCKAIRWEVVLGLQVCS